MALIEVGASAPAFELLDQDGTRHTLAQYRGRRVVLYFYPKDDTSGCTAQACQFRDATPAFGKLDAVVLGVSPDGVASHEKFAGKYGLTFPILADVPAGAGTPRVCSAYGVWQEKSMYGKKYMGVVRTTYLIDAQGKVERRWDKVSVEGHAEEVLAALRGDAKPAATIEAKPALTKASQAPTTKSNRSPAPKAKAAKATKKKASKKAIQPAKKAAAPTKRGAQAKAARR